MFASARDAAIVLVAVVAWGIVAGLVVTLGLRAAGQVASADQASATAARQAASYADITTVGDDEMVVSVAYQPVLMGDMLRINFVVVDVPGAMAERIEVRQGEHVVYASKAVQPGDSIEWAHVRNAQEGEATATVYAVDADGYDVGLPVDVELTIVPQ